MVSEYERNEQIAALHSVDFLADPLQATFPLILVLLRTPLRSAKFKPPRSDFCISHIIRKWFADWIPVSRTIPKLFAIIHLLCCLVTSRVDFPTSLSRKCKKKTYQFELSDKNCKNQLHNRVLRCVYSVVPSYIYIYVRHICFEGTAVSLLKSVI